MRDLVKLLNLSETEQRHAIISAAHGYQRLADGEPIEALTTDEVAGMLLETQAKLAAFMSEIERRRRAAMQ